MGGAAKGFCSPIIRSLSFSEPMPPELHKSFLIFFTLGGTGGSRGLEFDISFLPHGKLEETKMGYFSSLI